VYSITSVNRCLFRKFKDITWPWPCPFKGQFVIPMLNHHLANQCTKFEISSFSHSGDIVGGLRILIGYMTITTPPFGGDFFYLCGIICVILHLAILIQYRSVTDTHTHTHTHTHRQTDGRRHDDGVYRASIASHGKKWLELSTPYLVHMLHNRTSACINIEVKRIKVTGYEVCCCPG